ncbi:MAG: DUF4153 domain-containing protein [Lewinellaceae bacterium]|nr:DUF4153 domain-containing protein [Lewinellaceae bacterium]
MKLPSLSFLAQAFVDTCARFPATMLCAFTGSGAVMSAIEFDRSDNDNFVRVWLMAQLGLALCTGLTVFAEARGWNHWRTWGIQAIGLAVLAVYFVFFDMDAFAFESVHIPRYLGFLAGAHLLVAVAPYLNRAPVADFWEYNKQLFANFVVGGVYAHILFGGLALALLAVNELFNLDIDDKMYAHLFVLLAGVFQTAFFLAHFPRRFGFDEQDRSYNAVFKNLCQYILIPIVGLYFLILYAYSVKILVTWNLPHGWVSSLVLGFSVAGIFTYLINYLLPQYSDIKIVHAYRKWFWWVLLPMVGLLFVAIGRRISDYGITPERYYVAHAGVWLLAMCGYFLWSKTDNIKFIPISLGLFVLVAVVGPFSAFNVAQRNQTAILQDLFEKNNRFEGGLLQTGGAAVPEADALRIQSSLILLSKQDALHRIESWFPVPLDSIARDTTKYGHYERATSIAKWLNAAPTGAPPSNKKMVTVYPRQRPMLSGNIAGYRTFHQVQLYGGEEVAKRNRPGQTTVFSEDRKALLLLSADGKITTDSLDLSAAMRVWMTTAGKEDYYNLPDSLDVVELRGRKFVARLYLQEARFDKEKLQLQSLTGVLFVK